jgi:pimeloyl-ACP methyl ester carboxylesterase
MAPEMRRRAVLASSATALAAGAAMASGVVVAPPARAAGPGTPWRGEYTASKQRDGEAITLALYRCRASAPVDGEANPPVLFLVHGSSNSALSSFDLSVHAPDDYSLMAAFASYGFDVWTMDHEGYGKSSRTSGNSDIASGVADLQAAMEVVAFETRQPRASFFGESSGALRAAAFAMARPDSVERLVLEAFTYTGKGSPTLAKRGEAVEFYRTHNRRPRDIEMIRSIFTRDRPGTSDMAVADALAKAELIYGDTVPTGTYLDMTAHLPVVDPAKVLCPVLLARGEYDGIATLADLVDFYERLPNGGRQLVIIPGAAHAVTLGYNRAMLWHVMRGFLTMPAAVKV